VLIFDSADGGMVAATLASIERWKAGALSDAAFWHQGFFDPPEKFAVPPGAARRSVKVRAIRDRKNSAPNLVLR